MDAFAIRAHVAGNRTTKRAPSTGISPSALAGPMRFSAQIGTAMGLDDLLGDRQAQAGILAKALMRAVGVKAFEDPFERIQSDAGAVIIDHDLDLAFQATADDPHLAARRRE